MFRCTGYGECSMVFTRSEHLARHVRKHTGERPFKCHCGRLFSRLDNVRQHATTVHADEVELNTQMMKELTALHNQLSATTVQRQVAMGMVVKDGPEVPVRKPKALVDPNKPKGSRATKMKAKKTSKANVAGADVTERQFASTSKHEDVKPELDTKQSSHRHEDNVSLSIVRSQGENDDSVREGSPPHVASHSLIHPSPAHSMGPATTSASSYVNYPPGGSGGYSSTPHYNPYQYNEQPQHQQQQQQQQQQHGHAATPQPFSPSYGNATPPSLASGSSIYTAVPHAGSPTQRRRIAPPQPPPPPPPPPPSNRYSAYTSPYMYGVHTAHGSAAQSHSASASSSSQQQPLPSPPGSSSGIRGGVTLPSISNLLPVPFGARPDDPPAASSSSTYYATDVGLNPSSAQVLNASSGSSHVMPRSGGSSHGRASPNTNAIGFMSSNPYGHEMAGTQLLTGVHQAQSQQQPHHQTHLSQQHQHHSPYDYGTPLAIHHDQVYGRPHTAASVPYNDQQELGAHYAAYGHVPSSHQYLKQQSMPISHNNAHHAHHLQAPGGYHYGGSSHLGVHNAPPYGSMPLHGGQPSHESPMSVSDYYAANAPRMFNPSSRESSERSSIGPASIGYGYVAPLGSSVESSASAQRRRVSGDEDRGDWRRVGPGSRH